MKKPDGKSANKGNIADNSDGQAEAPVKKVPSYSLAKEQLKLTVKRTEHDDLSDDKAEIAIEVIEEDLVDSQPMKRAFIAEHLFRKTIEDAIPCGIAAMDNTRKQIYVNQTFCGMLGWDEKQLLGATFPYKYWAPDDIARFQDSYLQVADGTIPANGLELPFLRKNGEKFWGWILGSSLYNSEGESAGHLIAIVDISLKKKAEDALKQFSYQLVNAREKERKNISQDLHDSIGGRLAGLKYSVEKIIRSLSGKHKGMVESLNELLRMIKSAIEETRRISKNLHPSVLDDLGLSAALRELVREFRVIYPAIRVDCVLEINESRLSNQLKILIFRVCQEALTNIGKHSRADQACLRLRHRANRLELSVIDNGIGIRSATEPGGLSKGFRSGLLNMRERVDLADGKLEVASEEGKGVHIRACWPIDDSSVDP